MTGNCHVHAGSSNCIVAHLHEVSLRRQMVCCMVTPKQLFCVLQRMAEHDQVHAEEVEGANDFLRATKQEHESLRRRHARPQNTTATAVQSSNTDNV